MLSSKSSSVLADLEKDLLADRLIQFAISLHLLNSALATLVKVLRSDDNTQHNG